MYHTVFPLTVLALSAVLSFNSSAKDVWVSPTGNDADDGSVERPFATLDKACTTLRESKGGTVYLKGGTYTIRKKLTLSKADSGIAFVAAKGEHPILSGGTVIRNFVKDDDGLWSADLRSAGITNDDLNFESYGFGIGNSRMRILSLYRNGEWMTPAREPNTGFFRIDDVIDSSNFVFRTSNTDAAKWLNEKNMIATGYWKYFWADQTYPFRAENVAGTSAVFKVDFGKTVSSYKPMKLGQNFFIGNARAALDLQNEWYLDRHSARIVVKDPTGEFTLASFGEPFISIDGADDIKIEGLEFTYGRTTAVNVKDAKRFVFRKNIVHRFGGFGLTCVSVCDTTVDRNVFHTFGNGAVSLNGGNRRTLTPSGNVFCNNDIYDTGRDLRTYCHGLSIGGVGVKVVHNHFHDLPTSALCIPGNDHFIASNIIERVVMESDDQGGIDVWGSPFYRGTKIVHNIWRNIGCGGEWTPCGQAGIRFDDMIGGMYVYGNRFENCSHGHFGGVQIHAGRENEIVNNLFVDCRYAVSISCWNKDRWIKFWYPNTPAKEGDYVFSQTWQKHYGDLTRLRDMNMENIVTNNIVVGAESLLRGAGNPYCTVMTNDCIMLPAGTKVNFADYGKFKELPPESELGIRPE